MNIPIPQGMDQAPVTWTLAHTTGRESLAGARGFVRFEPTAVAVALPSMTVLPRPVEARVVGGVMEPVDLMVNDPELWNWRVVPEVGVAWAAFHVDVLGPVDLATVAVVPGKGPIRVVTGPPGKGLNLLGEKPSIDDLPAGATEGDAWLVGTDLHVWGGGRWVNAGPIQGPQGPQGERGPQGEKGEKGDPGDVNNHTHPVSDVTGLADRLAALEYRSGRRDITSLLSPAPTSGKLYIERRGDMVWLHMDALTLAATSDTIYSNVIASGFQIVTPAEIPAAQRSALDAKGGLRTYGGSLGFYFLGQPAGPFRGMVSWPTKQPVPSTLPGTPA